MWTQIALALIPLLSTARADLQPTTYVSPSGDWELLVDPSDRRGFGPSTCRVRRGDAEVWAGELPFTFAHAVIDDVGTFAGCGYVGAPPYAPDRQFFVAIVRPDGEVVLDERHEMQASRSPHTEADPKVAGILLQPLLRRFVVRVQDPDVNRCNESWWLFDLATGTRAGEVRPREHFESGEGLRGCATAVPVPRTPLVVAQWITWPLIDARFVLLDPELRPIWSLCWPSDYAIEDDDVRGRLLSSIWSGGALLDVSDGGFELWSVAAEERVRFRVEPEGRDGWRVAEEGRRPWPPEPSALGSARPEHGDEPSRVALIPIGVATLDPGPPELSPVRDVLAFDVSPDGAIRFVRSDPDGFKEVRLDPEGELLEELVLAGPEGAGPGRWTALARGGWMRASEWLADEEDLRLTRVSCDSGVQVSFELSETAGIEATAVSDDRVAILQGDRVSVFDLEGHPLSRAGGAFLSVDLLSPEDLALGEDERLAVLDNVRDTLQVFDAGGELELRIDLETALPSPPNYPSGLEPDLEGGWILHDFGGDPPVWRLSSDGRPLVGIEPRFADGSTSRMLARELRREDDGHLWTTDRASILRLTEEGVVDLVVGPGPAAERMTEPGIAQVDLLGRILIQDRRTGAIHLFDRSGARLAVAELEPEELKLAGYFPHAVTRGDGSFLFQLGRGADYADFGPDGTRVGRAALPLSGMILQPGGRSAWGQAREGGVQRIELGGAVLRTLQRHEDGTWISGAALAMAPDGSLVLHSGADGEDARRLSWYDPEGELAGTLTLPPGVGGRSVVAGRGWAALVAFGPDLFVVDLVARRVARAAVSDEEGPEWCFGASPDGRELWAIQLAHDRSPPVLYRFAPPSSR